MSEEITLRQSDADDTLEATIPKELAEKHNLQAGDRILAIEAEEGILLAPYPPDLARAMEAYEKGARKYRDALRELAE